MSSRRHPGELYPRVGFIVTNMSRPPENVVAFYNKRGLHASDGASHGVLWRIADHAA
jgi:hypothetical protein